MPWCGIGGKNGAGIVSGLGYTAALVLAGVLVWASVAKLARPRTTAASFAALGVPVGARLVPIVELGVAAALVALPTIGALLAGALLLGFTVVLVRAVRRGTAVGCACFGGAASQPVSIREVVRNIGLLVLAGFAAWGRPAVPGLADVVLVTTAVAVAAVGLALASLHRDLGRLWDNRLAGEASL